MMIHLRATKNGGQYSPNISKYPKLLNNFKKHQLWNLIFLYVSIQSLQEPCDFQTPNPPSSPFLGAQGLPAPQRLEGAREMATSKKMFAFYILARKKCPLVCCFLEWNGGSKGESSLGDPQHPWVSMGFPGNHPGSWSLKPRWTSNVGPSLG